MNIQEYHTGIKQHFKIQDPKKYLDAFSSFLSNRAVIDIIKFDEWLHQQFGEYEEKLGFSMKDLITKEFGESATSFIKQLI